MATELQTTDRPITSGKTSLSALTFLGRQINSAVERGEADCISFYEVSRGLEDGDLLDKIEAAECKIDLSLFPAKSTELLSEDRRTALLDALRHASEGLGIRERRRPATNQSGLSLLMAYTLEAIQLRSHWT